MNGERILWKKLNGINVKRDSTTPPLVIMPSEYTDEIENSSYTRRAFSMGRKSKYSAEKPLNTLILNAVIQAETA